MAATFTPWLRDCMTLAGGSFGGRLEPARFVTMTAACTASANASTQVAMRGPCASTSGRHLSGGGSPSSQEAAFMGLGESY